MLLPENEPARKRAHIVTVGGGKGGVGKSCVAVNLSVEIARRGWRTVLVDADLGCANVEAMLGVRAEQRLDQFFVSPQPPALDTLLTPTRQDNLRLLAGSSGTLAAAQPRQERKRILYDALLDLNADVVVIDLDAGAHPTTLDFYLLAQPFGLAVITPERTSIDNAFKFLRSVLFRKIERFYGGPEVGLLLRRHESLDSFLSAFGRWGGAPTETKDELMDEILALARAFRPRVIVNKANNAYEAKIAQNILAKYTRQHLRVEPEPLGFLTFDTQVSEAVNSGIPFVCGRPRSQISGCILDMANRLGYF